MKIVTLCGSTRFKDAYEKAYAEETAKGNIVLTVECFGHLMPDFDMASDYKKRLDKLHLYKIAISDEVLILNVDGYVGSSTKNEIATAKALNKIIRYLEKEVNK